MLLDSAVLRVVARSFIQARNIYRGRENSLSAMMLMTTMLLLIGDVVTCLDISLLSEKYDVKVISEVVDEVDICSKKLVSKCILSSFDRIRATYYLNVHSLVLLSEDAVVGILQ